MFKTKIIAHRGFSGIAPENTIIAFKKAIEIGADYFELDVQKSFDNLLVVIHDENVNRTTSNNGIGSIATMNSLEIGAIRVGYTNEFGAAFKNEKLPTLFEALTLAKGRIKVCIEIKVEGIESQIVKMVRNLEMMHEVIIFSFHGSVLSIIKQLEPDLATLYLVDSIDNLTFNYAQSIKVQAVGVGNAMKISNSLLKEAHSNHLQLWQWTINSELEMSHLLEIGIDGIITNYPDKALLLRSQLHQKEAKNG